MEHDGRPPSLASVEDSLTAQHLLCNRCGFVRGHPARCPRLDTCSFRHLSTARPPAGKGALPLCTPHQGTPGPGSRCARLHEPIFDSVSPTFICVDPCSSVAPSLPPPCPLCLCVSSPPRFINSTDTSQRTRLTPHRRRLEPLRLRARLRRDRLGRQPVVGFAELRTCSGWLSARFVFSPGSFARSNSSMVTSFAPRLAAPGGSASSLSGMSPPITSFQSPMRIAPRPGAALRTISVRVDFAPLVRTGRMSRPSTGSGCVSDAPGNLQERRIPVGDVDRRLDRGPRRNVAGPRRKARTRTPPS